MADWNQDQSASDHKWIVEEVAQIRDSLTNDVVNYYYDPADSEDAENEKRDGMRRYLRAARDRINQLLDSQLAN